MKIAGVIFCFPQICVYFISVDLQEKFFRFVHLRGLVVVSHKYLSVGISPTSLSTSFEEKQKMKKLLLIALVMTNVHAYSQKNIPVLIKADFGPSNVKYEKGRADAGFLFGIGLETYLPLIGTKDGSYIVLNPGVSFQKTGYEPGVGQKVKVNYINVVAPVLFKFGPGLGSESPAGIIGVGPFVSYALSGKFNLLGQDDRKMAFGNGLDDNRKAYDAGLVLKAGYQIKRVALTIQKNIGFVNLIPKERIANGSTIKSRNFMFSLAYALNTKVK